MALSISTYAILAVAAALLVAGVVATARYMMDPVPEDEPGRVAAQVSGPVSNAVPAAVAPAAQARPETGPTRVTVRPTHRPAPEQAAATPMPPTTPNVVSASRSNGAPDSGGAAAGSPEGSEALGGAGAGVSVPVAEAVAPLGDSIVVAWHYIDATDEFVYYDPELPEESTLKAMTSGKTYLIMVDESVTVVIDGKELHFVCDENTCWNTVVWP